MANPHLDCSGSVDGTLKSGWSRPRTNSRPRWQSILALFGLSILPLQALAGSDDEIAQLKARIELLEEQLARIEARFTPGPETMKEIPEERLVAPSSSSSSSKHPHRRQAPDVRVSADLRYRHDLINDAAVSSRHHHRVRARASAATRLTERIAVGFGLSTGGVSNDSANQTLGDGFSLKPVGLDLAYFDWSVSEQLSLVGGKMVNPFYRPGRHHLLYDDDLRPEGLVLSMDSGRFFGSASVYWAEERALGADSLWLGIQAGFRGLISQGLAYTAAAGFHEITNTQGRLPIFTPLGGQGNLLDSNGGYLYGFSQAEVSGELEIDVYGYPVTLFLDYVTNTAADTHADGIAVGLGYQRDSDPGNWHVSWVYQDLDANAVVGAFTDSDFGGGTSDSRGHVFRAGYWFPGGWRIALRYIEAERGKAADLPRDYSRLQADIGFSY